MTKHGRLGKSQLIGLLLIIGVTSMIGEVYLWSALTESRERTTRTQAHTAPVETLSSQVAIIEQKNQIRRERLTKITAGLPPLFEKADWLRVLSRIAEQHRLVLQNFEADSPMGSDAKNQVRIQLTLEGRLESLAGFLRELTARHHPLGIQALNMSNASPHPVIQLELSLLVRKMT